MLDDSIKIVESVLARVIREGKESSANRDPRITPILDALIAHVEGMRLEALTLQMSDKGEKVSPGYFPGIFSALNQIKQCIYQYKYVQKESE